MKLEDYRKQFIERFKTLIGRQHAWRVWQDFVTMAACAISNSVDRSQYDKREKLYMDTVGVYTKEESNVFAELLGVVTSALDSDPEQDFLGELFMSLELGNHWRGQFFTPYHVCKMMGELTYSGADQIIKDKGYVTVSDCAAGAGALLIASANSLTARGYNYQQHALMVAQDVDYVASMMCYIQLSLLGIAGYVIVGDTLARPGLHPDNDVWYTPMYFHKTWHTRRMVSSLQRVSTSLEKVMDVSEDPTEQKEIKYQEEAGQLILF